MSPTRSGRSSATLGSAAFAVLAIAACSPYRPLPDDAVPGNAEFELQSCPPGTSAGVRCGHVQVPMDRAAGTGVVSLAVFVIPSKAANPEPDPVVYLEGGPGGAASGWLPYAEAFAPVLERRALVLVDQRGTGKSVPALRCQGEAPATCRARLTSEGVDLAAFHTAAIAADLDDVRHALGYARWNLLGVSYGTRLGLALLRDFPDAVRAAVLDSIAPPDADWLGDTVPGIERALRAIFDACRADKRCAAAYPGLEDAFWKLVDVLDAQPATVTVGGQERTVDGDAALNLFLLAAYDTDGIATLPELVFAMREGDLRGYASMRQAIDQSFDGFADGMYLSVVCRDVAPFSTAEQVTAKEAAARPRLAKAFGQMGVFDACRDWDVPPSPAKEREAVASDVPALLLSGSFDPITPPAWARATATHLPSGHLFERPDASHGVFFTACGAELVRDFLADPSRRPNPTCAADATSPLAFQIPDKRLAAVGLQAARTADGVIDWAHVGERVAAASRARR